LWEKNNIGRTISGGEKSVRVAGEITTTSAQAKEKREENSTGEQCDLMEGGTLSGSFLHKFLILLINTRNFAGGAPCVVCGPYEEGTLRSRLGRRA